MSARLERPSDLLRAWSSVIFKESGDRRGKSHQEDGCSFSVEQSKAQVRKRLLCIVSSENYGYVDVLKKLARACRSCMTNICAKGEVSTQGECMVRPEEQK